MEEERWARDNIILVRDAPRRTGASLRTWRLKTLQGCGTGKLKHVLHARPLPDGGRTRKGPQPVSWVRRDLQEGGL